MFRFDTFDALITNLQSSFFNAQSNINLKSYRILTNQEIGYFLTPSETLI